MLNKNSIDFKREFLIIGLGGSGCNSLFGLIKNDSKIPHLAVDTDSSSMNYFKKENIYLIGDNITNGNSTGGDIELARQAIEKEAFKIREILKPIKLVIIIAGLGGGTASGSLPVISRIASEVKSQVLVFASLPFIFEGKKRVNIANESIKRTRFHADAIVRLNNERISNKTKKLNAETAFKESHKIMINASLSLWLICSRPGICGLDFSSINTILRYCDGFCHYVELKIDKKTSFKKSITKLINHPSSNKGLLWKGAPGVIILIRGNESLKLYEIEAIMEAIHNELSDNAWVNFGMQIDKDIKDIYITSLVAESWKEPLVESNQSTFDNLTNSNFQNTFELDESNKGVFSDMDATIYNNEDLDIPTYRRRNIKLPK